ncbi:hypothetical protein SCP_1600160 [Sparassis crispa]|uniref:Uncharacterized protein n=1 Tax=Sparassis crispa TaxID=139825 RepID=A0A401H4I9_9APHY|nr:hypothetical protein SCP_1600160 [Sparassis crispa]GBE89355.1 hypothetical protein SCP_1600160 [Sparassis crispa]
MLCSLDKTSSSSRGGAANFCSPSASAPINTRNAFPPSRIRSVAFATFAAGAPAGAAVSSIIGSILTQLAEQRRGVYFMTGVSALVFVGGFTMFDKGMPSTAEDNRVDWLGSFLVTTASLVMIVFVLSDENIATDGQKTSCTFLSSASVVLFNVAIVFMVAYFPVIYLAVLGTTLTGVANMLLGVINPTATYWAFGFPATVLMAFGADFVFPSGTLFIARLCLPHEQSIGGALLQTLMHLGGAFDLAITTVVYDATLKRVSLRDGIVINVDSTNVFPPPCREAARVQGRVL